MKTSPPVSTVGSEPVTLGNIALGRPNLGLDMPVAVYRLFQFNLRNVLTAEYDEETAQEILFKVGRVAGSQFCRMALDLDLEMNEFLAQLQQVLVDQKIGVLRVESLDPETLRMTLVIAEDLDCSGLPVTGETVCNYDEGFIAGILEAYTGQQFTVREIDCWANGARVCRFDVRLPN